MNDYEARIEAKRERYAELAERKRRESEAAFKRVHEIADFIPMGQPILVGHHSEKRHRADIARMDNGMRKGIEADKTANYYADKAANYGAHGISSDDPNATDKLQKKLAKLEQLQELMRDVNRAIRKGAANTFEDRGITPARWILLHEPDFCGRVGFPDYELSNNNAEIRRLRQRISELEKRSSTPAQPDQELAGLTIRENADLNRLQLIFDAKPDEATRATLKSYGFRWSPSEGAWQRQISESARYKAHLIAKQYQEQ